MSIPVGFVKSCLEQCLRGRVGLSARQVQRHIADLEEMGLVQRIERKAVHRGKLSNEYDPDRLG
jgi:predicted ArsR family transcriptional regulator